MNTYNMFLDESGSANPVNYKISPYFSLSGIMVSENKRKELKEELNILVRRVLYYMQQICVLTY